MKLFIDSRWIQGWGRFWVGACLGQLCTVQISLPGGKTAEKQEDDEHRRAPDSVRVASIPPALRRFATRWGFELQQKRTVLTAQALEELREYTEGRRRGFSLPVRFLGTRFQISVWEVLCTIPWGEVRTYKDIAVALGNKGAARAVGQANRRNPLPIIVPCHRVVSVDGLGGYSGGMEIKKRLLQLEGVLVR